MLSYDKLLLASCKISLTAGTITILLNTAAWLEFLKNLSQNKGKHGIGKLFYGEHCFKTLSWFQLGQS